MTTTVGYTAVHIIYALIDISSAIVSLGFYRSDEPTRHFTQTLREQLFFAQGFDLRRTGVDFIVLSLIRIVVLGGGALIVARRLSTALYNHALALVLTTTLSYAQIKILLFAEYDEQLRFVGVWLSTCFLFFQSKIFVPLIIVGVGLSVLCALANFILWLSVTKRRWHATESSSYAPLNEETTTTTSDREATASEPKPKFDRESAAKYMKLLLIYTARRARWFVTGFILLFIYSAG